MADLLNTSVSGLIAFQRALDTTSHNIANVGTEGYSRQRVDLATRPAFQRGNGWIGSGVDVTSISRVYDQQLAQLTRNSSSAFSGFDAFATQAGRVNNLFADQTTGLSATLQGFSNALHDVANSPASIPARQVLLSQAQTLTNRLKSYGDQLNQVDASIESQLKSQTDEISTLATSIAQLNARIAAGFGATGQPPNDLLDQRDKLIDQLSQRVDVSAVTQADGQVNVFVGSGQPLVLGADAAPLILVTDPYDPSRHGIGLGTNSGQVDITGSITGGTLGGLLDFREQVLDPVKNALGQLSVGLAGVLNDQHHDGMDLNGAMGGDLFAVGGVQTFTRSTNTGTGDLTVTRTGVGALTTSDYELSLTSTGWQLRNATTGGAVTLSGTGTALDPFTADGLSVVVTGTPQVGDKFLIKPTAGATAGLGVLITDPAKIAAAAPIRTSTNVSNTGGATISAGSVVDSTNAQLRSTVNIQFNNPPTTYSVNGAGSFAYTTGNPITINGWTVAISGSPAAGDQFTVSDNTGGTGDNRNALLLANAAGQKALVNGTASLNDAANRIVGTVGIATRQAQASRDAQEVVYNENISAQQAVSGVNLDEEATNMLRYQQAYQAAAQIIKVADTLFQTLLNSVAR